ncbi:YaiO family outer membrane beta-barrel protein [Erythrobacter sp. LQ02-29]|uniref:YaiO family outer membrane beta-barrel protein n=1 Tax=Erythrobacter sp. LQ02-29 TaxID=2920384 RepID=UPI001F4F081A|nr:YaiO family outer membrane beta-barrel protein [Erythrobacter sp. LQ02-29]MCP9223613.1 YaiO family outer membrane beta-barrel protein [Erythrobacter sp. LQ02-29]
MTAFRRVLFWWLLAVAAPLAAQTPEMPRTERIEQADRARAEGNFEQARAILSALLADAPDDAGLLRRLAVVQAADNDLDAAQATIDRALRLAPDDLDIQLARGNILSWRGQTHQARAQAAAMVAVAPDYPELDQLQARLMRAEAGDRPRIVALSVVTGFSDISFDNRDGQTWYSQSVAAGARLSDDLSAALAVEREKRASTDTRLSARIDRRIDQGFIYLSGSVVPNADFRESWSMGAGGEYALGGRATALLDLRYADYGTGGVFVAQPGIRLSLARDVALSARAINLFGGGNDYRLGGALQLDYRPEGRMGVFASAASYPDVEADQVRQLRSGALGVVVPLNTGLTLTAIGAYDDRKDSYRRLSANLVLGFRFGDR